MTDFLTFDLAVRPIAGGTYRAQANIPGMGIAEVDIEFPFSEDDLAAFRAVLGERPRDLDPEERGPQSSVDEQRARVLSFGRRLYETVFVDDLREGLGRMLTDARNMPGGLRIRLHLDEAPAVAELPWEYLYRPNDGRHLAVSERTPIIRFLRKGGAPPAAQVEPPLNILVMLSNPPGYAPLQVDEEWANIRQALDPLIQAGAVTIDKLPNATYPQATGTALSEQLGYEGKAYHVFHFVGHGGCDSDNRFGLVFEGGPDGQGELVVTDRLRQMLDHFSLRLVILNSCEGARTSHWDAYSGVAQGLVRDYIAAVIAMQIKITDKAAICFATHFYKSLAIGKTVEDSLSMARKQLSIADYPTEWGTPVLFSQSEDGRLFQIDRPTEEQKRQARIELRARDAVAAIEAQLWAVAIDLLKEIVELKEGAAHG